jgi:3-carboxy-cis,cis-muconate cycloisomerase
MLLDPQFRTAETDALWSPAARLRRMLAFEGALALAQAELGLLDPGAAQAVAGLCADLQATELQAGDALDADALFAEAATAGNPAIPFVRALTRAAAARSPAAADAVHLGATSQDVLDTATMLALADALDLVRAELSAAADAAARLAARHADTPIAGRTLLQQATPVTFGYKAAVWAAALDRAAEGAARAGDQAAVQLGGAVGTLPAFGARGADLRAALARRLGLADPGLCWHVLRDRVFAAGTALALACGAAAKVARDVQLLMQAEVAEAAEGQAEGKGGSSAMPHKRNPVDTLVPVAAAQAASGLLAALAPSLAAEHERPAGAWHAEWLVLPQLSTLAHAAARAVRRALDGLEVDPAAMARNLDAHRGLLAAEALASALSPALGRARAKELVERLARRARDEGAHLRALAEAEDEIRAALPPAALDRVFSHADAVEAAAAEARRILAARPAQARHQDRS